uniref:non-specific serine/threonine protein kinase n=1 Tax=Peromyscus maniculatus bairdii TaxID=230844 RepID=A0A8C8UNF9_PERMB
MRRQELHPLDKNILEKDFRILTSLASGGFGKVKLACHLPTHTQVAVKVLKKKKNSLADINTEVEILQSVEHRNIVNFFHVIDTSSTTYLIMEYHASRGDLVSHIEKVGCLQEEQAQHIFTQIVCAVHYCHKNGIAHRDIKLDNILLDGKGSVKLCDFGLAIRVTSGQRSKGFCGTLEYCAPELFTDTEYDARAVDIWSLGVVLYTMVTASFPFKARTYSDMKEEMLNPCYYLPSTLSQNIVNLIVQLFTMMPEQRPRISDIMQHQWFKDREEFWQLPLSSETYSTIPNPSLVGPNDVGLGKVTLKYNGHYYTHLISP